MVETHPAKIIETKDGNIVMESPDLYHTSALSNSVYTYMLTNDELLQLNKLESDEERNKFIHICTLKKGFTMYQLTILAYVKSAPWHLNDYATEPVLDLKSFLDYISESPDLLRRMADAMGELGKIDPLSP